VHFFFFRKKTKDELFVTATAVSRKKKKQTMKHFVKNKRITHRQISEKKNRNEFK